MESYIIPTLLGVLASVIAGLILIWLQFRQSTAGYRVNMVRKATEAITAPQAHTSMLRDKYRYSLGVIIDDLHQSFRDGFKENGPWPALVDNGEECECEEKTPEDKEQDNRKSMDRWDKFNKYIRPIIEDINTYSFIGLLRLTPALRQLHTLTHLCHRLEDVVGELDAAFENRLICIGGQEENRIIVREGKNSDVENLRGAYGTLFEVWRKWHKQCVKNPELR